ncbi:MAG TPA: malto-oligosyltrehalose trehalohydrolase, partial [Elusimicrobiota bacterium]|nr:malto-oligosyltrehalose trehalohydrolase [Elusimicrobiota bacterium]
MTKRNEPVWRPSLGACVRPDGVLFRVWAPDAAALEVVVERAGAPLTSRTLRRGPDGRFAALVEIAAPGDEYRYRVDGAGPFPD